MATALLGGVSLTVWLKRSNAICPPPERFLTTSIG
jgi:hypothetical protein